MIEMLIFNGRNERRNRFRYLLLRLVTSAMSFALEHRSERPR